MRFLPLILVSLGTLFAESPNDRPWQILDAGMQDGNPAKRIDAVLAMGVITREPRSIAALEAALNDKDSGVRQAAAATLGELKARGSIPKLQDALSDSAPEVVFAAAKTLYEMGDPLGRQVLIAVLVGDQSDASGFVSSSVRDVKLKLHDPKALLLIGVNAGAGFALGPFGAGVPIAERLLKDNQASGKTAAALLLTTDTTEESKSAVKEALGDKNWTVRVAAARATAIRGIGAFYPDIVALMDDKRDEVRYSAAAAAIRLKQTPARAPRKAAAQPKPGA